MNNSLKIILVFLIAAMAGFGGGYVYKVSTGDSRRSQDYDYESGFGSVSLPRSGTDSASEQHIQTVPADVAEPLATVPELSVSRAPVPELNVSRAKVTLAVVQDAYYYVVSGVRAETASDNLSYTLSDAYGHIYTSPNGKFPRVDANSSGTYSIVVTDLNSNMSSEPRQLRGFKIVNKVTDKLTASKLTEMIGSGDYDTQQKYLAGKLASNLKISCANEEYNRPTIQEVFLSVGLDGWTVTVTSVGYNYLGQVSSINLNASK